MSLACVCSYWLTQWCVLAWRPITGLVNWYGCHANTEWYYKWYSFDRLKNREAIQLRNILVCIVLTTWNVVIAWALNTFLPKRSYQTFRLSVASASCCTCSRHSVHRAHGKHVRSLVWLPKPLDAFWLSWHNGTSTLKFVEGISCVSLSVRAAFWGQRKSPLHRVARSRLTHFKWS
jgi:hypothetical protein